MLNAFFRSLSVVIVGVLLIVYKDAVMPFVVQLIGIAFMLPGLIALGLHLYASRDGRPPFWSLQMLTSLGSVAFGLWLLFAPGFFIAVLMKLFGIILLLIGVYQVIKLLRAGTRNLRPSIYYYILPVLVVLLGLFALFNPLEAASVPFIFIGAGGVMAGISDFINSLLISRIKIEADDGAIEE